jgi:hypothetical protein
MARTQRGRRSTAVMVTTMTDTDELLAQVAELRHQVAELGDGQADHCRPPLQARVQHRLPGPGHRVFGRLLHRGPNWRNAAAGRGDKSAHGMRRQGGGH